MEADRPAIEGTGSEATGKSKKFFLTYFDTLDTFEWPN